MTADREQGQMAALMSSATNQMQDLQEQRRARTLTGFLIISALLGLAYIGFSLYSYGQQPVPQFIWDAVVVGLALVMALVSYVQLRRGRLDAATYWAFFGVVVSQLSAELFWEGETLYNLALGVLLILVVGVLLLPRKWYIWMSAFLGYTVYVYLIGLFTPLPRYNYVEQMPESARYGWVIFLVLGLVALWMVIRALRTGTIGTRLLVAFVLVVLLPVVVIGGGVVVTGLRLGESQTIAQLESVATLKTAEIQTWITTLQDDLQMILISPETLQQLTIVLADAEAPQTAEQLRGYFDALVTTPGRFEELFVLDTGGYVVISSNPQREGASYSQQPFFVQGLQAPYVQPPLFDLILQETIMLVARPIYNEAGQLIGVLAGYANLQVLSDIMVERSGLGETGETYLVRNYDLLTALRFPHDATFIRTWAVDRATLEKTNGSGVYPSYHGSTVIGVYHWVPELRSVLVAEQQQQEALAGLQTQLGLNVGIAIVSLVAAVVASLFVTQGISAPLNRLVERVERIAEGDLALEVPIERQDEIGILASAVNSMREQLRDLVSGLEQRVEERTLVLEQRSVQLQAASEVARQAAEIQDIAELLDSTVHLISQNFDFYHAGLFLLDEAGAYAVLRAASSPGGQQMLARGHKLAVGQVGIVGYAAATGEPRIALDVGEDAQYFNNPDLPLTRSEMALPMKVRGRVIGVLDVQSTRSAAFTDEDVAILLTMSDQVALAIENARLLANMQDRLQEISALLRTQGREAWTQLTEQRPNWGYRYDGVEVLPYEAALAERESQISLPLQVRAGGVIGELNIDLGARAPTAADRALIQDIIEQASLALDSARLFQQTQGALRRADALYQAGRSLINFENVEDVLSAVAEGVASALPADRVSVITFDLDHEAVTHFVAGGPGKEAIDLVPFEELQVGLSGWVLERLQPALSPSQTPDPRESPEVQQRRAETDCGAIVVVPLLYQNRILGTMTAINRRDQPDFTQEDVDLMMAMANQAAAAIRNAQLFEEMQSYLDETEALYRGSQAIGEAASLDDILTRAFVAHAIPETTDQCVLVLLNEERQRVEIAASWRRDPKTPLTHPQSWAVATFPWLDERQREFVALSDVTTAKVLDVVSREVLASMWGVQSCAVAPLLSGEQVLGWVMVEMLDAPYTFTERDARLLRALSDPAAVMVQNLQLFRATQRQAEYERRTTEITAQVRATTDIEAILRTAVRELGRNLRAEDALIVLDMPQQPSPNGGDNDDEA